MPSAARAAGNLQHPAAQAATPQRTLPAPPETFPDMAANPAFQPEYRFAHFRQPVRIFGQCA
jgi:hypothetical protein